ncbi:MAG: ABC transporter ATP-binding protein/permease [Lachnospiraceae bacterium]|nr:ABC transporter ATP-binding protein/permease [Lachnospiraceae bacterium]
MLELKNIVKDYPAGDQVVRALKGVTLNFRKSEFVSILGQSGCGKTTLLNIIGGLDKYTDGDLCINGISTKKYNDRKWDAYRNHSVGFIFQSYNLIPHQSVLQNVELALTISGVSKKERRRRAIETLTQVGLGDQIYKKPNQMSGGQMQRVAIARALINDPEILLADEPTGALDSETSVQVMNILKSISNDRLIIMVTHNPDLAYEYSSRIIKLLDGKIVDDSNPYEPENNGITEATQTEASKYLKKDVDENGEPSVGVKVVKGKNNRTIRNIDGSVNLDDETCAKKNEEKTENGSKTIEKKKPSMSFFTAVSLSLNNLMTKKARTFLTAFAGSIGIIGIALILSLSSGFQAYIDKVQEDTLSTYPLTIQSETIDFSAMLGNRTQEADEKVETRKEDVIRVLDISTDMYNAMITERKQNDLASFKKYLEQEKDSFDGLVSAIGYTYDVTPKIYSKDLYGNTLRVNPSTVMDSMGMSNMSGMYSQMSSIGGMGMMGTDMDVFCELLDNQQLLQSQYDVIAGRWPSNKQEMIFVVTRHNMVSDTVPYALGLMDQSSLKAFLEGKAIEKTGEDEYTYDQILGLPFKLVLDADFYEFDEKTGTYVDKSEDAVYMAKILEQALELKIVGIVRPKEGVSASAISNTIGYTRELTEYVIEKTNESAIVKKQIENPETDVFTGRPFAGTDAAKEQSSKPMDFASMTPEQQAYFKNLSPEELQAVMAQYAKNMVSEATYDKNLKILGVCDLEVPSTISLYPVDFESKDKIEEKIAEYNATLPEGEGIRYTDYIGVLLSSITTIINAVTYVLIAFVAISLVVSSIMIGIITYISVLERTKEIGVLRSIGASKRDVKRVFNAETLIIGLVSGTLGIAITVLLDIPINFIINHFAKIGNVAALPWQGGVALILISMFLTIIAGLLPASMAAKKDPVVALRTE